MSYDFSDDLSGRSNDPEPQPAWLVWLIGAVMAALVAAYLVVPFLALPDGMRD